MSDEWKSVTKTYEIYPDHMECEDYLKVLLTEEIVFINNGWWDKTWPTDKISVHVNCSDVFSWGAADTEDINHGELKELYDTYVKDPVWGAAIFCIKRRKQRPQTPVYDHIKNGGIWDIDEITKDFK